MMLLGSWQSIFINLIMQDMAALNQLEGGGWGGGGSWGNCSDGLTHGRTDRQSALSANKKGQSEMRGDKSRIIFCILY